MTVKLAVEPLTVLHFAGQWPMILSLAGEYPSAINLEKLKLNVFNLPMKRLMALCSAVKSSMLLN